MDQIKIGKFIAERRKAAGLTQMQLAERLNITDRAVSKWECGRTLPDSAIMLKLCNILKISVTDLLTGETVLADDCKKELENDLLKMIKQKEENDKMLLKLEIVLGFCCLLPILSSVIIVVSTQMIEWLGATVILTSLLPLLITSPFLLRIEQKVGYYECKKCGHRHIPCYKSVFFAVHINRSRYMHCPRCKKLTWQKKVLSKE